MKTRRHNSNSPTMTPATIPFAPRCGKSYHLLLNFRKLSRNSCKEISLATARKKQNKSIERRLPSIMSINTSKSDNKN